MKLDVRIILCCCIVVVMTSGCFAEEWKGIMPLLSTRAEVIKLLGPPRHLLWDYRDFFEFENGVLTFTWIDPSCKRTYPIKPDSAIQPNDLVLGISLRLQQPVPVTDLRIADGPPYFSECFGGAQRSCTVWRDGFGYSTSAGQVTDIGYGPSRADFRAWETNHPRCVSNVRY